MKTEKADIGLRIREARGNSGITGAELGNLLGVGKQAVSSYENGRAYPTPASIAKIADICNTTTDWLITGKDPATPSPGQIAEEQSAYQGADEFEKRILGMLRRLPEDSRNRLTQIITTVYFDYMESKN